MHKARLPTPSLPASCLCTSGARGRGGSAPLGPAQRTESPGWERGARRGVHGRPHPPELGWRLFYRRRLRNPGPGPGTPGRPVLTPRELTSPPRGQRGKMPSVHTPAGPSPLSLPSLSGDVPPDPGSARSGGPSHTAPSRPPPFPHWPESAPGAGVIPGSTISRCRGGWDPGHLPCAAASLLPAPSPRWAPRERGACHRSPANSADTSDGLQGRGQTWGQPGGSAGRLVPWPLGPHGLSVFFPGFEDCPLPAPVPRGVPAPRGVRLHRCHAAVPPRLCHHLHRAPEVRPRFASTSRAFTRRGKPTLT